MDDRALERFEESLHRCNTDSRFLDRFYERFLGSSPKVRRKFAGTDFVRQKRMLQASLQLLLVAAQGDGSAAAPYLDQVAARHGAGQMAIGAELYDLWLDALLATVRETDPAWTPDVEHAWEDVMTVGIRYLLARYHHPGAGRPEQEEGR
jgi:hemoglobin-like flavoprotein